MWIGVARIKIDFFGNDSISKKRENIESLCKDLKKEFNVSVGEVADFDDPESCIIGFATIIPETWRTQSAQDYIQTICKRIDETAFSRVVVTDWDLLAHGPVGVQEEEQ
ncbi:MAG: DUF503 family protein [Xanthomonadaceae bacterium]|nr:DUF503 family protein [Xanthomonadaceae bacterium]